MGENKKKVVNVNTPKCISCGACISICPDIFKFNKEGKSEAVNQPKNESQLNDAKQAENICPVKIITVEEKK